MAEGLLKGFSDLIKQVFIFLGLYFFLLEELLTGVVCLIPDVCLINSFNYNPIGDSLSCRETTTVILNYSGDICGAELIMLPTTERNHNRVVQIVQVLAVVPLDEPLKFLFEIVVILLLPTAVYQL